MRREESWKITRNWIRGELHLSSRPIKSELQWWPNYMHRFPTNAGNGVINYKAGNFRSMFCFRIDSLKKKGRAVLSLIIWWLLVVVKRQHRWCYSIQAIAIDVWKWFVFSWMDAMPVATNGQRQVCECGKAAFPIWKQCQMWHQPANAPERNKKMKLTLI